jgi:polysaccharide pyruvyl transferase WcaK-like protein
LRIAVLGWYGHGNLGDEAMLEGIKFLAERYLSCHDFLVMTTTRTSTVPVFDASTVNRCDLLILGGGELISPRHVWLRHDGWQRAVTVPKVIMGSGVDGTKLKRHVLEWLRDFSYIGLRDNEAFRILSEDEHLAPSVHLTLDPSIALASKYKVSCCSEPGVAAVIPTERRVWPRGDMNTISKSKKALRRYVAALVYEERRGVFYSNISKSKEALRHELSKDHARQVKLLAFGGEDNDDLETCKELADYLKASFTVSVLKPSTPEEALRVIASCEKVYSYRLHGMFLAFSVGVPFSIYPYHLKLKRNYDTLKKLPVEQALKVVEEAWDQVGQMLLRLSTSF